VISARIIGELCGVMKVSDFMKRVLPKARTLCQDFNWEVRNIMCANLERICLTLGTKNSQTFFFEEVLLTN
jgi:hypothetical protein